MQVKCRRADSRHMRNCCLKALHIFSWVLLIWLESFENRPQQKMVFHINNQNDITGKYQKNVLKKNPKLGRPSSELKECDCVTCWTQFVPVLFKNHQNKYQSNGLVSTLIMFFTQTSTNTMKNKWVMKIRKRKSQGNRKFEYPAATSAQLQIYRRNKWTDG